MKPCNLIALLLCLCLCIGYAPQSVAEDFTLPEMESGKVVLSWTDLKQLLEELERSRKQQQTPPPIETPPADYTIRDAQYTGAVAERFAAFDATLTVQILKNGWVIIPFFPKEVGIESATIDQESAQFIREEDGYRLLAKGASTFTVRVRFRVPIRVENLTQTFSFRPPRAVINQCSVRIPGKGITIVPADPHAQISQLDDGIIYQTVLGELPDMTVTWNVEKAAGMTRKSSVSVYSLASIEKTAISVLSTVTLKNLTNLNQITLLVPPNVEILDVKSAEIDGWKAETTAQAQTITLTGQPNHSPAFDVIVAYRARIAELPATVAIPMLTVTGIEDSEGFLGVEVLENLEVTAGDVQNGLMIPAKNLPPALWQQTSSPLLHGYEFHTNSFSASLNVKSYQELETIVASVDVVDVVTHRTLEGKSITSIRYVIRNNDRQFLTLRLPKDSRLWQTFLDGNPVKPAQKESGEILIPMKKSTAQGEELQPFVIEIGYISDVGKLSLKGELLNELPAVDIPVNYLRWSLYFPENYEYTNFEGPLKHVENFSTSVQLANTQVTIPTQGKQFLFEKYLIVDDIPFVRGKYGQHLGNDIFLSVRPQDMSVLQTVTPNKMSAESMRK